MKQIFLFLFLFVTSLFAQTNYIFLDVNSPSLSKIHYDISVMSNMDKSILYCNYTYETKSLVVVYSNVLSQSNYVNLYNIVYASTNVAFSPPTVQNILRTSSTNEIHMVIAYEQYTNNLKYATNYRVKTWISSTNQGTVSMIGSSISASNIRLTNSVITSNYLKSKGMPSSNWILSKGYGTGWSVASNLKYNFITTNEVTNKIHVQSIMNSNYTRIFPVDIQRYGFLDNNTETGIHFNPSTKVFTLSNKGTSWSYYRTGRKWTITDNKTVTLISPTNGQHYIYIDSEDGTLVDSKAIWTLDDTKVCVATIYYTNILTPKFLMEDERHTCLIDRRTHRFNHFSEGTKAVSYGSLTGLTADSTVNSNKTFGIGASIIADEDLFLTIDAHPDGNAVTNNYTILYRTSSTTWKWTNMIMPFYYQGSGRIQYDLNGVMTTIGVANYATYYIAACNIKGSQRYMIIPGRVNGTLANAQAESFSSFNLTGIPLTEFVVLYKVIYQGNGTGGPANLGECRYNSAQMVNANVITSTIIQSVTHNSLSGLQGSGSDYYHSIIDPIAYATNSVVNAHINSASNSTYQNAVTMSTSLITTNNMKIKGMASSNWVLSKGYGTGTGSGWSVESNNKYNFITTNAVKTILSITNQATINLIGTRISTSNSRYGYVTSSITNGIRSQGISQTNGMNESISKGLTNNNGNIIALGTRINSASNYAYRNAVTMSTSLITTNRMKIRGMASTNWVLSKGYVIGTGGGSWSVESNNKYNFITTNAVSVKITALSNSMILDDYFQDIKFATNTVIRTHINTVSNGSVKFVTNWVLSKNYSTGGTGTWSSNASTNYVKNKVTLLSNSITSWVTNRNNYIMLKQIQAGNFDVFGTNFAPYDVVYTNGCYFPRHSFDYTIPEYLYFTFSLLKSTKTNSMLYFTAAGYSKISPVQTTNIKLRFLVTSCSNNQLFTTLTWRSNDTGDQPVSLSNMRLNIYIVSNTVNNWGIKSTHSLIRGRIYRTPASIKNLREDWCLLNLSIEVK